MKTINLILLLMFVHVNFVHAQSKVWFHPHDPSLYEIADILYNAQETIDIAMYNLDVTQKNPIISAIARPEIQSRLAEGTLSIRLIFEGYSSKESNANKMAELERLGIDARYLGASKKVHHKFAVIDGGTASPELITGSANWSLSSYNHYSENIVYLSDEPSVSANYQNEFNFLWEKSNEFGWRGVHKVRNPDLAIFSNIQNSGVLAIFNSSQFIWGESGPKVDSKTKGYVLTRKIVSAIDSATERIEIATTRIKLRPIYEAILRAADRGVEINIIVTMGQYERPWKRYQLKLPKCVSIFERKCSVGTKYSILLDKGDFPGSENVNVRLKYFNLKHSAYLDQQMHNKYMIVDNHKVWTGSFNWSHSSEFNHIENVLVIPGGLYPQILNDFSQDFDRLWNQNRKEYSEIYETISNSLSQGIKINCKLPPISLKFREIDRLQELSKVYKVRFKNVCL